MGPVRFGKIMMGSGLALTLATPGFAQSGKQLDLGTVFTTAAPYCPRNSTAANGRLLPVNQNQALFALLGDAYGGDGQTTFAVPNLQGRFPVGVGGAFFRGQSVGAETAQMTVATMPTHTHTATVQGTNAAGNSESPANASLAAPAATPMYANGPGANFFYSATVSVPTAGAGMPFPTMNPFVAMRYCIVVQGYFPVRQ